MPRADRTQSSSTQSSPVSQASQTALSPQLDQDDAPRVLIVRLSAIGDVVQSMPIACALRDRFPRAWIAWAVEQRAAALLEGHPEVDELITLPRRWLKSPGGVLKLRRRLRAMRFDVALEAQGLTKSAIFARLSGAPRRIGFGGRWGRELSQWINTEAAPITAEHVVDRNLQLLEPLGIHQPAVRFGMPEVPAEQAAAKRILAELGIKVPPAIINVGAGWPSKLWPTERFAAVARYLRSRWNLPTLLVYGPAHERRMAEQMAKWSAGAARLAPPTTLTELRGLARAARLFIGCDTGPLHLAAGVGTPCVGLFGPWPASQHGPYGEGHVALQAVAIEGTRQRRKASPELMRKITVEQACRACERVLRRSEREAA